MSDRSKVEMLLTLGGYDEDTRAKIDEYLDAGGDARGVFIGMAAALKWQSQLTRVRLTAEAMKGDQRKGKRKITLDRYLDAHAKYSGHKQKMFERGLDVSMQALRKYEKKHPHLWMLLPGAREMIIKDLKKRVGEIAETTTAEPKKQTKKKKAVK